MKAGRLHRSAAGIAAILTDLISHALDSITRIRRKAYERSSNDETDCRSVTAFQGADGRFFFLLTMVTAAFTEFVVRGKLSFAADLTAGILEVSGMVTVTLLFYGIFKPVNRRLSLLAASINLVGLTFETLQFQPWGIGIGPVFHGFYWLLIGYLIFRSTFLPRILGALMTIAGLGWLTYLSLPLVNYLSPYNLAFALLAEGLVMLWFLASFNVPSTRSQCRSVSGSLAFVAMAV